MQLYLIRKYSFIFFFFIFLIHNIYNHIYLNLYINKAEWQRNKITSLSQLPVVVIWIATVKLKYGNVRKKKNACAWSISKWILIDAGVESHAKETPTGGLLSCYGYRQYFGCYGKPVSCRRFCISISIWSLGASPVSWLSLEVLSFWVRTYINIFVLSIVCFSA